MTRGCLDEGLLQAYVDGELSQAETGEAASHVAACESCAAALANAESEAAVFSSAFAVDNSLTVPTEALRARINAAVAQLESTSETNQTNTRGWNFGGLLASLSSLFDFTPQRAAAFASIVAVVAVALIYFAIQRSNPAPSDNQGAPLVASVNPTPVRSPEATPTPDAVATPVEPPKVERKVRVLTATYRHRPTTGNEKVNAPVVNKEQQPLPGEKDYQTAIASLQKTIKLGGDAALRPAVRVEYERNLAILDNAIAQTRQVAVKNPKDRDAVGFLMSAYKSKVELLTQVADQAQVAALGR